MKTIYLCGPIFGCTDMECRTWRDYIKTQWEGLTIDPMRRDYRGQEHDPETIKQLVELDKADILHCDAVLVCFDKPSVGTSMEILYAWENSKLVVIVTPLGLPVSPWLRYHSDAIFNTFVEALDFIREQKE